MKSIAYIPASDGSAPASQMIVQNTRAPLSTTLVVNTVSGVPNNFWGTMGEPHTFIDPVTGEEITVISEASAIEFAGHVDGVNIEIDEIAPGFSDNGSNPGDIVIIRPTTEWANNIHNVLSESHEDDGKLKPDTVDTSQIKDESVTFAKTTGIWWEEIGRTTLGSANSTLSVSFSARKYLRVILVATPTASISSTLTVNGDTGANYTFIRYNGTDSTTAVSQNSLPLTGQNTSRRHRITMDIQNPSGEPSTFMNTSNAVSGVATVAPNRYDVHGSWASTNQVTSISINGSDSTWAAGSEIVVLGHD